jgi:hypothetical protein
VDSSGDGKAGIDPPNWLEFSISSIKDSFKPVSLGRLSVKPVLLLLFNPRGIAVLLEAVEPVLVTGGVGITDDRDGEPILTSPPSTFKSFAILTIKSARGLLVFALYTHGIPLFVHLLQDGWNMSHRRFSWAQALQAFFLDNGGCPDIFHVFVIIYADK